MTLPEDRRRRRSDDPLVALQYHLTGTRHDGSLDAIVVADDSGVVVAGAGLWPACEEMAAYAPLLVRGAWSEPGRDHGCRLAELRTEVDVHPVDVDGQTVLLCARGGSTAGAAIEKAKAGVARILRA
jgi:hypothetical protein